VVKQAGTATVGAHRAALPQKSMGAEDFSFFLEKKPGQYSLLYCIVVLIMHYYATEVNIFPINNKKIQKKEVGRLCSLIGWIEV